MFRVAMLGFGTLNPKPQTLGVWYESFFTGNLPWHKAPKHSTQTPGVPNHYTPRKHPKHLNIHPRLYISE